MTKKEIPESWPKNWIDHDERVRPYVMANRSVGWAQKILGLSLAWYWLVTPAGRSWEWFLNPYAANPFLLWLLYFGTLGVAWEIIGLPFDLVHYRIERQYGLSKQNIGSWFADKAKGLAVGAVLGTIAMGLLYGSIVFFPTLWWFVGASLLCLFSVVLAQLAPVILIPIFFQLKPLEASPLKDRLFALCQKFKVEVKEIYHLGLGAKTEKGNAAFVGLGRTKRILIGDTLYEKFSPDQVEAVFAHELGHQVHNDLWKGIILSTFFLYLGFYVSKWVAEEFVFYKMGTGFDRPLGILVFFVIFSLFQIPVGQVQLLFSRWRERMADGFAADTTKLAKPLGDALEKLTVQNFGQFRPNAFIEFFSYSHPAPWRRILRLGRAI